MFGLDPARLVRGVALMASAFVLLVQAAGAQGLNPAAVVDSYERAWAQQDTDAALAHLAPDAVITLHDARNRSLTSPQQIREFLVNSAPLGNPALTSARTARGTTVVWSEHTEGRILSTLDLTVQAEVENGKIQSLTYRPGRLVGDPDAPPPGLSVEPAASALGGVLLLGLGLLALATARAPIRAGSHLRGRLLRDLGHFRPGR